MVSRPAFRRPTWGEPHVKQQSAFSAFVFLIDLLTLGWRGGWEAVHRHSVVGAAGGRLAQGGGRALRRGHDGLAFGRCGGAVVVVEQDGRQAAAHVEFDVVGSVAWSLWHRWSSWKGLATRAAQEGSSQRDRELSSDCRDRVFDMPFGSDRRRLGVWDGWIYEMFGAAGGLRGESPLVRG